MRGRPAWVVCAMLAGGSGATGLAKKRVCRRATRRAEGAARSDRSRESVVAAAGRISHSILVDYYQTIIGKLTLFNKIYGGSI